MGSDRGVGRGLDIDFAIQEGSGGNFLLLAVYRTQPWPLPPARELGARISPQLPRRGGVGVAVCVGGGHPGIG